MESKRAFFVAYFEILTTDVCLFLVPFLRAATWGVKQLGDHHPKGPFPTIFGHEIFIQVAIS